MTAMPDFNATDIVGIFQYINTLSSNWFGNLLPISLFAVLFISFMRTGIERALISSSFIAMLFAIMLWLAGICQEAVVVGLALLVGIGAILNVI